MSNEKIEQISALMDGEIEINSQTVIDSINDEESRQTWTRYHLVRDSLQGQLPESIDINLADKISAAIAEEPTVLAPKPSSQPSYIKPIAGFAIAASVTAAVLVGVQSLQQPSGDIPSVPIANTQPINSELVQTVTLNEQEQQQFAPADLNDSENNPNNPRLNRYLMNYNELRANSAVQGMPPYVRMIGYEADK